MKEPAHAIDLLEEQPAVVVGVARGELALLLGAMLGEEVPIADVVELVFGQREIVAVHVAEHASAPRVTRGFAK